MGREENIYIGRTRECLRNRKICCIDSDGGRLEWVLKKRQRKFRFLSENLHMENVDDS